MTRQPASNRSKSAPSRVPTRPHQATYQRLPRLPGEMRSQIFRMEREAGAARVPHAAAGAPGGQARLTPPSGSRYGGGVQGRNSPLTRRHDGVYGKLYYTMQPDGSLRVRNDTPIGRVVPTPPGVRAPPQRAAAAARPRGRPAKKETKKETRSKSEPARSKPKPKGKKK